MEKWKRRCRIMYSFHSIRTLRRSNIFFQIISDGGDVPLFSRTIDPTIKWHDEFVPELSVRQVCSSDPVCIVLWRMMVSLIDSTGDSLSQWQFFLFVGAVNGVGHLMTNSSMGAVAVSFTHTVKVNSILEALFSSLVQCVIHAIRLENHCSPSFSLILCSSPALPLQWSYLWFPLLLVRESFMKRKKKKKKKGIVDVCMLRCWNCNNHGDIVYSVRVCDRYDFERPVFHQKHSIKEAAESIKDWIHASADLVTGITMQELTRIVVTLPRCSCGSRWWDLPCFFRFSSSAVCLSTW